MHKKKLTPLGNRVIVEREEAVVTKGGILLPESAQQKPKRGKIVAVGPGKTDDKGRVHPVEVKVGDRVLFASYGGTEFKHGGEELLILSEDDILAVF